MWTYVNLMASTDEIPKVVLSPRGEDVRISIGAQIYVSVDIEAARSIFRQLYAILSEDAAELEQRSLPI